MSTTKLQEKLWPDNPYFSGSFIVEFSSTEKALYRRKMAYTVSIKDSYHTIVEGEQLSDIAYKYYRNDREWHIIADANEIFNPFDLTPGQQIIIPYLPRVKAIFR
jgi:nucleoid-associated protein YgaU